MYLDGDEIRFTSNKASHFLQLRLFFCSKGMRIFAVLIEPRMSAPKIVARVGGNQMKVLVELIPDGATQWDQAFLHRKSNAAMLDRWLYGHIEAE